MMLYKSLKHRLRDVKSLPNAQIEYKLCHLCVGSAKCWVSECRPNVITIYHLQYKNK